jgi:hypothetical protein
LGVEQGPCGMGTSVSVFTLTCRNPNPFGKLYVYISLQISQSQFSTQLHCLSSA